MVFKVFKSGDKWKRHIARIHQWKGENDLKEVAMIISGMEDHKRVIGGCPMAEETYKKDEELEGHRQKVEHQGPPIKCLFASCTTKRKHTESQWKHVAQKHFVEFEETMEVSAACKENVDIVLPDNLDINLARSYNLPWKN